MPEFVALLFGFVLGMLANELGRRLEQVPLTHETTDASITEPDHGGPEPHEERT